MKDKEFEKYVEHRLNIKNYDEAYNSPCAVINRMRNKGLLSAIVYETKEVARDIKSHFFDFEGLDTSIKWFILTLLIPMMIFIIPFTRTYYRYKEALDDLKVNYERATRMKAWPLKEKQDEK